MLLHKGAFLFAATIEDLVLLSRNSSRKFGERAGTKSNGVAEQLRDFSRLLLSSHQNVVG